MSRLGELGGRLLLAAASLGACLLALAAVEGGLRIGRPNALSTAPALQPHVYSAHYGWALRPGFADRTRDGRVVHINDRGFRGPVPPDSPPGGRRRVILLGDSVTFGTGVEDSETFAAGLGRKASGWEVVNLGVSGYGTDQELLLLEREGFALRPDAVVLNVCVGNDALDNALPVYLYDGTTPKPFFTLEGDTLVLHDAHVRLSGPARLARYLLERSLALDGLLRLFGAPSAAPLDHDGGEHWGPRARAVLERWPDAVRLGRRLVARVLALCRERKIPLVVALHPNRSAFQGDASLLEPFQDFAAGAAAPLDLGARYAAAGLSWEDLALDKLGHLTPRGHDAAAAALADALSQAVEVPPSSRP